jgi:hypothetical protein
MSRFILTACLLFPVLVACSPLPTVLNHSPQRAAEEAQRFAEVAFVDRDFRKAYGLLSESGKGHGSAELFEEFIAKEHQSAFPLFVKATDYEPVPGQKRINIYIYGENGGEKFYYRVITVGVKETGYKVAGFDRFDAPYARLNLRHLEGPSEVRR